MGDGSQHQWTDREYLRAVQYRGPANLQARQSIYAFQQPRVGFHRWALGLAGLLGGETVVDVGCGNGAYLAELNRSGHRGTRVGVDLSEGMARSVREQRVASGAVVGDAPRLPLPDGCVDAALCMHMLYHVPDRPAAVRELRRITRPGGVVLMVLNHADHLHELRHMVAEAGGANPQPSDSGFHVEDGRALADEVFKSVIRHDVEAELVVTEVDPVVAYVASMNAVQSGMVAASAMEARVRERVGAAIAHDGAFRVRTHSGCLVCR